MPVDAIAILKRLREEKKAKKKKEEEKEQHERQQCSSLDVDPLLSVLFKGKGPIPPAAVVATGNNSTSFAATYELQSQPQQQPLSLLYPSSSDNNDNNCTSPRSSNELLWTNESLFERTVKIETTMIAAAGQNITTNNNNNNSNNNNEGDDDDEKNGTNNTSMNININLLEDPIGRFAGGNGATLWDCSIALTNVLVKRYCNNNNDEYSTTSCCLRDRDDPTDLDFRRLNVLELGAGLGLVGIAMASIIKANVVVTERSIAIPLLQRNVEHNKQVIIDGGQRKGGRNGGHVTVSDFSWGNTDQLKAILHQQQQQQEQCNSNGGSSSCCNSKSGDTTTAICKCHRRPLFDIVVMSDLIFPSNSDSYSLLVDTLVVLLFENETYSNYEIGNDDNDGTTTTTPTLSMIEIWLSHEPRRPDVEATFWCILNEKGIYAHRIPTSDLPDSHPVDIDIYLLSTIKN